MKLTDLDYIQIKNLKLPIFLGVHEWERHSPQQIRLDLTLYLSIQDYQDNLENTICYDNLSQNLSTLFQQHVTLLETVAQHIADFCLKNYPINAIEIIAKKYHAIHNCEHVSVRLLRWNPALKAQV